MSLVVHGFFKNDKHADGVISQPRIFVYVFSLIVVFLSIFRGATLEDGDLSLDLLPMILLFSTPMGIAEGYDIYLTIKVTLSRTMNIEALAGVYTVFLLVSINEIIFINVLCFLRQFNFLCRWLGKLFGQLYD